MIKKIQTDKAPEAVGPYSQTIETDDFIFVSGQIAIDHHTGEFNEGSDIKEQTNIVLNNLKNIIEASGSDINSVVKTEIFLRDINDFKIVNEIYGEFFINNPKPARQTVEVSKLPLNAKIEISCIVKK